ncbi:hypothetical protein RRG08_048342 [Elysia crispata]|uniref:Uncharacterized protein n=1 Tax=Elysia crispata TaxID=231223 RepID=A0AAE0YGH8_9GAST|nr:hypothetical protein RRG08_048342 [Elysia crispata]
MEELKNEIRALKGTWMSHHIRMADGRTHIISINRLAGGKAEDYSNHEVKVIEEMCQTYADFHGMSFAVVHGIVLSKILSALTDRAVNHKACQLINLHLGLELIEINCNLHVLDGFANEVCSALKLLETKTRLDIQSLKTEIQEHWRPFRF